MILLRLLYIVSGFVTIVHTVSPKTPSSTFASPTSWSSPSPSNLTAPKEWTVLRHQCHDRQSILTQGGKALARWSDCVIAVSEINKEDQSPWPVLPNQNNGKHNYKMAQSWEHRTCFIVGEMKLGSLDWPVLQLLAALMEAALMVLEKCVVDWDETAPGGGGRQGLGGSVHLSSEEHGGANIVMMVSGNLMKGYNPWPRNPFADMNEAELKELGRAGRL